MKRFIVSMILLVILFGVGSYYEHNYTREECRVTDKNDAYIEFVDQCGWTWVWRAETEEDIEVYRSLEIDDEIDVKIFDNLTSADLADDIIKEICIKTFAE